MSPWPAFTDGSATMRWMSYVRSSWRQIDEERVCAWNDTIIKKHNISDFRWRKGGAFFYCFQYFQCFFIFLFLFTSNIIEVLEKQGAWMTMTYVMLPALRIGTTEYDNRIPCPLKCSVLIIIFCKLQYYISDNATLFPRRRLIKVKTRKKMLSWRWYSRSTSRDVINVDGVYKAVWGSWSVKTRYIVPWGQ